MGWFERWAFNYLQTPFFRLNWPYICEAIAFSSVSFCCAMVENLVLTQWSVAINLLLLIKKFILYSIITGAQRSRTLHNPSIYIRRNVNECWGVVITRFGRRPWLLTPQSSSVLRHRKNGRWILWTLFFNFFNVVLYILFLYIMVI